MRESLGKSELEDKLPVRFPGFPGCGPYYSTCSRLAIIHRQEGIQEVALGDEYVAEVGSRRRLVPGSHELKWCMARATPRHGPVRISSVPTWPTDQCSRSGTVQYVSVTRPDNGLVEVKWTCKSSAGVA